MSQHEGESHGHTPASWAAVIICIVGFLIGGAGLMADQLVLAIVGGALALAAPLIGWAMAAAGLGAVRK
jgi:hypothetical protein